MTQPPSDRPNADSGGSGDAADRDRAPGMPSLPPLEPQLPSHRFAPNASEPSAFLTPPTTGAIATSQAHGRPVPYQSPSQSPAYASPGHTPSYGRPAPMPHAGSSTAQRVPGAGGHTGSSSASAPSKKDARRGRGARATVVILSLLLPIGIVAGAVAGFLYADRVGAYDVLAVEREVAEVLRDDYGLSDLRNVLCPDWIKVEQGQSFQCEFEYAGANQTVTVTQGAQSGQLVVGAPE